MTSASRASPRGLAEIAADRAERDRETVGGAVPGFLPNGLTVLYGGSGTFKTFLMVGVAVRLAAGLGIGESEKVRRGLVIYFAAEDLYGVEDRALAAAVALGIRLDVPFFVVEPPGRLQEQSFSVAAINLINDLVKRSGSEPTLIVVDTLAAAAEGISLSDDGPVNAVMGSLLRIANQFRCSVAVTHHTGKHDEKNERGSRVIRDRADLSIEIEAKKGEVTATVQKSRNGPSGSKFKLTFAEANVEASEGDFISTLMLSDLTLVSQERVGSVEGSRGADERRADAILHILLEKGSVERRKLCEELSGLHLVKGKTASGLEQVRRALVILRDRGLAKYDNSKAWPSGHGPNNNPASKEAGIVGVGHWANGKPNNSKIGAVGVVGPDLTVVGDGHD